MFMPGQNQLAKPEVITTEGFETTLATFKARVIEVVAAADADLGEQVRETLENEAEIGTKIVEACALVLNNHIRQINEKAAQGYIYWATGDAVDARVSDLGVERQIIDAGDADAYPPVAATYESDDDVKRRYYLEPHAPAAGSRMHYRREAMTLSERALATVETPEAGTVVVTYTLDSDGMAAKVKDANGRRTSPGEVAVTVLSREGDGTASAELLAAVAAHFARPDVVPETDAVTVRAAEIVPYTVEATVWINPGPDAELVRAAALEALQAYATERHGLGERIDRSWLDAALHGAGAERLTITAPATDVVTADHQAPFCAGIAVEVLSL